MGPGNLVVELGPLVHYEPVSEPTQDGTGPGNMDRFLTCSI